MEKTSEMLPVTTFFYIQIAYFKKDAKYCVQGKEYIKICDRKIDTNHWLEFLGYYLSEGSSTITKEKHYIIQIRQFGDNLNRMAAAFDKVTPNKTNIKELDGRVIVNDKDLCIYLKETFGDKYNKHIPRDILNECSKAQLMILFNALMLGDGHDQRDKATGTGGSSYNTSSVKLRDDFMELLLKIGYSGSFNKVHEKESIVKVYDREYKAKADNWNIYIKFKNNTPLKGPASEFESEKIIYKGKVGCVTVKNQELTQIDTEDHRVPQRKKI
jgi:hypothetical protein